jgi:hypothetical protein
LGDSVATDEEPQLAGHQYQTSKNGEGAPVRQIDRTKWARLNHKPRRVLVDVRFLWSCETINVRAVLGDTNKQLEIALDKLRLALCPYRESNGLDPRGRIYLRQFEQTFVSLTV